MTPVFKDVTVGDIAADGKPSLKHVALLTMFACLASVIAFSMLPVLIGLGVKLSKIKTRLDYLEHLFGVMDGNVKHTIYYHTDLKGRYEHLWHATHNLEDLFDAFKKESSKPVPTFWGPTPTHKRSTSKYNSWGTPFTNTFSFASTPVPRPAATVDKHGHGWDCPPNCPFDDASIYGDVDEKKGPVGGSWV
jgi:hypothetical protein